MPRDRATGIALLAISVIVIILYNVAMWFPSLSSFVPLFLLKLTDSVIITLVLAILAWIGYTLATTPPPRPIEEIEKELERELKSLTTTQGGKDRETSGPTAASSSS